MAKKMLKSHHLAILALVLALGIATPIAVATLSEDEAARAADESGPETSSGSNETDSTVTDETGTPATEPAASATVSNFDDLKAAIADSEQSTITLGADIELSEPLTIARDLTLDLGTHKITVADGVKSAFIIRQGDVTLTGAEGSSVTIGAGVTIWVYGSNDPSASDYTHLTVDENVLLVASATDDSSYGIAINRFDTSHNVAYGVEVDFNGKLSAYNGITILGYVQHSDNAPVVKIGNGALIDAEGTDDSMAIYAAGYGVWTVGAADLTGSSALGAKAGQFTFNNTVMTANGACQEADTANGSIAGSGAVFQLENNSVYAGGIDITIDGGEYTSTNGHVFYEYGNTARATSALRNLTIDSGTFNAGPDSTIFSGVNTAAVTIAGGSYNREITADYLGADQKLVENDGVWTLESTSTGNQPGTTTPDPDDEKDDPEPKPEEKPSKPSGSTPGTGVHNITNHISAIATTTSAVVVGVLVFFAFVFRHLARRRSGKSNAASAKTSREVENSRTKVAGKAPAKSTKSSKSAKSSAKSSAQPARKTKAKSTKSAKSTPSAKATKSKSVSKTVKSAKPTKARK